MIDNLISEEECNYCIDLHKRFGPSHQWGSFFPMMIDKIHEVKPIVSKIENTAKQFKPVEYDWGEIVYWPTKAYQDTHYDNTDEHTSLTSITYLNQDYDGGRTFFVGEMEIQPKIGRTIFFDGKYFLHGVSQVTRNSRFTLPIWYKTVDLQ